MSIDLDWDRLTGGHDGQALAETIRAFIDDRFQQVTLPKMIRSVSVHSFEFGSTPPELQLKDVSDPLPDFYEDSDEEDDGDVQATDSASQPGSARDSRAENGRSAPAAGHYNPSTSTTTARRRETAAASASNAHMPPPSAPWSPSEPPMRPPLSRASTPGIPGGTSNMSYFHLPLSAGLSGAATPFGAFGGPHGWLDQAHGPWHHHDAGSASRRHSEASPVSDPQSAERDRLPSIQESRKQANAEDLQIVAHVKYSGDIRLTVTADILLDYPMPSFVGIPLQLRVTGMTFDGIAILAYIKHKAHFCFLSPEDAEALVGEDVDSGDEGEGRAVDKHPTGKLFEEIRVESEIGKRASGKQVLKNVSKVEKFVLEQVRRIFENEFVYPSFWTFLV